METVRKSITFTDQQDGWIKLRVQAGDFTNDSERPELAKDASTIADSLKYYSYKAHVIFYQFDHANEIFIIRILGKRMNFIEHL